MSDLLGKEGESTPRKRVVSIVRLINVAFFFMILQSSCTIILVIVSIHPPPLS